MTTTKSYSNSSRFWALYRGSVKRQMPFLIISALVFILALPVVIISMVSSFISYDHTQQEWLEFVKSLVSYGVYMAPEYIIISMVMLALLSMSVALFAFSYLHSKKTTDFYHSQPVRREALFGANLLASLTCVLGPFFAVILGTALVETIAFQSYGVINSWFFAVIGSELLCSLVYVLVIYLMVGLVAVNVGTVFDTLAISTTIGFSPLIIYMIIGVLWDSVSYGANFQGKYAIWLCPFLFMGDRYNYLADLNGVGYFECIARLLAFGLILAVVIFVADIYCYRRRKSEVAEQAQASGVFQTIVKCVAAFCGAMLFYMIFMEMPTLVRMITVVIGAVAIGIIPELILSRNVRHIKKNLLWLGGTGVFSVLLILGLKMDFTGYVSRVPNPDNVSKVNISYQGRYEDLGDISNYEDYNLYGNYRFNDSSINLTDPQSFKIITDMHRMAVDNAPNDNYDNNYSSSMLNITYTMKNGSTMERSYYEVYTPAVMELIRLEGQEEFKKENHAVFINDSLPLPQEQLIRSIYLKNSYGEDTELTLSEAQKRTLLDAMQQDILKESYAGSTEEVKATGFLEIYYKEYINDNFSYRHNTPDYYTTFEKDFEGKMALSGMVLLTPEYTGTLKLLSDWGYTDAIALKDDVEIERIIIAPTDNLRWQNQNTRVHVVPSVDGAGHYDYLVDSVHNDGLYIVLEKPEQIKEAFSKLINQAAFNINDSAQYLVAACQINGEITNYFLINQDEVLKYASQQDVDKILSEWNNYYGHNSESAEIEMDYIEDVEYME